MGSKIELFKHVYPKIEINKDIISETECYKTIEHSEGLIYTVNCIKYNDRSESIFLSQKFLN